MIDERKAKILAELKQYSQDFDELQPTDITPEDVRALNKVSDRQARNIIKSLAEQYPDRYKRVRVRNPKTNIKMFILRPIYDIDL
jgi:hypothetical protein